MLSHTTNLPQTTSPTSQNQMVQYCQPLQYYSQYQQPAVQPLGLSQQSQLQHQLQHLYQKQQESQQMYNQLGQNIQQLFQNNFSTFGNRFFEQQNSVLSDQQQQQMLLQQEYLKQQMQNCSQQQQQIQTQLQQQYDTHGNRLLDFQHQYNQQLASNLQNQNIQFQSQQASYTQQVNQQYQQALSSFKSFLQQLLQSNTDTITNKFLTYYNQVQTFLETKLEDVQRDLTLTSTSDKSGLKALQSQQQALNQNLDNLQNISTFIQKDFALLLKTQHDLYNSSIEGNAANNEQQCNILNFCFKQIVSKLDHMSTQDIDHVATDVSLITQYIHSLKSDMKDIQKYIGATVDSIILSRFDKFEQCFDKKVDDVSKLLTVNDCKFNSSVLRQTLPKPPSQQSIVSQNITPPYMISQQYSPQNNLQQQPITSSLLSQFQSIGISTGPQPSQLPSPPLPHSQFQPLFQSTLPPQVSVSLMQQHIPLAPPPPPPPPPTLPFMAQPPPNSHSTAHLPAQQQSSTSVCTDLYCQDPSCTTLKSKHTHIPMYNGSSPLNYWLRRIDREIQAFGYTDHQAFLLAQAKLDGDALFWLDQCETKFLVYQHPTVTSLNKFSYQLLKPQLSKQFTKPFEDFFEDLDRIKQRPGQSYKRFMRKLQVESQHGSISMRYLKTLFVRNISNRIVALHLNHFITDDTIDLQKLATQAIRIDTELSQNRSRSRFKSSTPSQFRSSTPRYRTSSPHFSNASSRSHSSSRPSYRSNSNSSFQASRSQSPYSSHSNKSGSSGSAQHSKFKRYKSPSDRSKFRDKADFKSDRKVQHVSLSAATSISRPKSTLTTSATKPPEQDSILSPSIDPVNTQKSGMISTNKQTPLPNKDVTNYSIRDTLHNLKVQCSLSTLLRNSKSHLQSFYDFVQDIERPDSQPVKTTTNKQCIAHVTKGTTTRITASPINTMKCLNVLIKNYPIQAVLDGGSQPSLINASLCTQLGYTKFKACDTNYSMVDSSTFAPLGILSIPIQLSDVLEVQLDLVVVKDCDFQLLLGLDFITCTQMVQYPTKVQIKNPSTKVFFDLPIVHVVLDRPSSRVVYYQQTQSCVSSSFFSFLYFLFHIFYFLRTSSAIRLFFIITLTIIFISLFTFFISRIFNSSRYYARSIFSLTRIKQKPYRQSKPIDVKTLRKPKYAHKKLNVQHILYPNFPTTKYNLILCDAPWQYQHVNALSPSYRTLSFSQLKSLPISSIAAPTCVFIYWTTGVMLDKALSLCKTYGFKHLTVFHVWRKLSCNNVTYKSKTNIACLTQPNMEFLIISTRGDYKSLLHKTIPSLSQDLPSHVLPHSQKPKQVYQSLSKIFKVFSFPCIELFARCTTHPFLDLYGDSIPHYFQPSQKVLHSTTHFSKTRGYVMSVAKSSTSVNIDVTQQLTHFPTNIHSQLSTLLKDTPFIGTQLLQCMSLLSEYLHIFAWQSHAVGRMTNIKHSIKLLPNAQPKAFVPYRLSQEDRSFVESKINELLKLGYIERCVSPWASPVIVVPKEGGKRMVIDFRYLNSQTIKEHWPLPNFQDFLSYLPNATYISKIDLKSGFFNQLYSSASDEDLTSFVCHLGQFKTKRLWFGLCNAPSSFQRSIMDALGSLVFHCVLVYIDDILIYSSTFKQHLADLTKVFSALKIANVKLHPTKCSLFTQRCDFLGHTISAGTITPKLKRYSLLQHMSPPKSKTQVKCFLGLISYYRRFLKGFSSLAKPLTDLLQKNATFTWNNDQQVAFDTLRTSLLQLPTLHLPLATRTFVLNTDFSSRGIGAVLQQQDKAGIIYPIEFISRTLNKHESKYGSYEGETLAVMFALSRFRHYLMGQNFILQTDNHALQQVLKNKSNSPKIHRWLLQLSDFTFTVVHKKGKDNTHADALSRLAPLNQSDPLVFSIHPYFRKMVRFSLKPYTHRFISSKFPNLHKRYIKQQRLFFTSPLKLKSSLKRTSNIFSLQPVSVQNDLPYQPIDLQDLACQACNSTDDAYAMNICEYCGAGFHTYCFPPCPVIIPKEFYYCNNCISKIQRLSNKDPILDFSLLNYLKSTKFPSTMPTSQRDRILQRSQKYMYKNKTFYISVYGQYRILPTILARQQILYEFHDNTSHPGSHKTLSLIMHKYFWPSIRRDVRSHIKHCSLCICKHAKYRDSESLQPLPKGNRPFQFWHIDLLTDLPPTKEDFKHILVCIDSFSKWSELTPLKNRSAIEIAHGFYRDVVCRYGAPETVISDNGGEFSAEFSTLLQYINTHQKFINPNRPRSNGQVERFVQTTTRLLRSTIHSNNIPLNEWVFCIPTVLYTLRMSATVHTVSPFQIIHGFLPNLISPLNTSISINDTASSDVQVQKYVDTLAAFQDNAFRKIAQRLQHQYEKGNYYYSKKSSKFPYSFKVNDLVFKSAGRTSKLQLKSEGPFVITNFKNPTTVVLLDTSNNKKIQSSVYNLIPIPVIKNNTIFEPQQISIHKRNQKSQSKPQQPKSIK